MSDKISINKNLLMVYASFVLFAIVFIYHIFSVSPDIKYLIGSAFSDNAKVLFSIAFSFYFICLIYFRKNLDDRKISFLSMMHIIAFTILLLFTFFNSIYAFLIVLGISSALVWKKIFTLRDFAKIVFAFFIIFISATTMFQPAVAISKTQGTVLSDNWWNAFLWIKNNTKECAVIATYWDPGHFITGIAKRAAVFDGASQNAVWKIVLDANATEEQIREAAVIDKYTSRKVYINGEEKIVVETARIQDIATAMYTSNETLAVKILEKYKKPGCDEIYFLSTADLIGKSHWWTYFSTWNPIEKGCATPMSQLSLAQIRPISGGGTSYVYDGGIPAGCNRQLAGQVVIVEKGNETSAFALINNKLETIERLVFFTPEGGFIKTQQNATVGGTVILDQGGRVLVFIPKEIQDSVFTKTFFFNGYGLEKFQFVNSWGGEVKLYKVII